MLLNVFADRIERKVAPEKLPPGRSVRLRRIDLSTELLATARGKGMTRVNFASGDTYTVFGAGLFRQQGGRTVLALCAADGDLYAQLDVQPAYEDGDY